jgi:DNA-binding NtrC family response regulator
MRRSLRRRLENDGHDVVEAGTAKQALRHFEHGVDMVLLDYELPDGDGFDLLRRMHATDPEAPVIMFTAHASIEHAVAAIKAGAYHYAAKPFDFDQVALLAARALETTQLRRQVRALRERTGNGTCMSCLVGESQVMRDATALLTRISESPASTVLITGESGTGKDLAARAIHNCSDRSEGPFLNITCSALPATLLESELFGHERGAFTDAKTRKEGLLEHADRGTVFLDEIGELAPALQAKLLRFLEEKSFRRVGGVEDIHADVRVIAATHVDLRDAVREGKFREDLYYRLAVLTVHLPALRARGGDAELLAQHFLARFNREFKKSVSGIDESAMRLLRSHPWPGNIRELRNAVERAVLLGNGEVLTEDDFDMISSTSVEETTFRLPAGGIDMRDLERSLVIQALERAGGNKTRAASMLGMNRDQIRYRMEIFGLSRKRAADS